MLCEFICANYQLFQSKNIIELGSGTGLCSIVASKVGNKVTLSDKFDNEQSLNLCKENIRLNGVKVNISPLEWGNVKIFESIPKIDVIIGSDCFYDELDFEDILCTVSWLLDNSINTDEAVFYFAYQVRSSVHSIECLAKKWKLVCRMIPFKSKPKHQVIEIYELRKSKELL